MTDSGNYRSTFTISDPKTELNERPRRVRLQMLIVLSLLSIYALYFDVVVVINIAGQLY